MQTDDELKAAFAAFLLETPKEPFVAALKLYPSEKDRGKACKITFEWPSDPFVLEEMERLKADPTYGQEDILTKKDLIRMALEVYNNPYTSAKEKNGAIRLIGELQSLLGKDAGIDTAKRMPLMPVYKIVNQ